MSAVLDQWSLSASVLVAFFVDSWQLQKCHLPSFEAMAEMEIRRIMRPWDDPYKILGAMNLG